MRMRQRHNLLLWPRVPHALQHWLPGPILTLDFTILFELDEAMLPILGSAGKLTGDAFTEALVFEAGLGLWTLWIRENNDSPWLGIQFYLK